MVWVQTLESPRMPQRSKARSSPLSASSGSSALGSCPASPGRQIASPSSQDVRTPLRRNPGVRLPREGASPGGGEVIAARSGWMSRTLQSAEDMDTYDCTDRKLAISKSTGSLSTASASPSEVRRPSIHKSASSTWHPGCSAGKASPGWRRQQARPALVDKQDKLAALRQWDQKRIAEKVEHGKQLREERFDRLLNETQAGAGPVFDATMTLRKHETNEDTRRRNLYATWSDSVYEPLKTQIESHLSPPDRVFEQALSGSKTVGFQLPGQSFSLQARHEDDPTWKDLTDHAWEDAFDREATAVLEGWCPLDMKASSSDPSRGLRPLGARTRPALDPTSWGQLKLQGTLYGRFAQVVEEGPHARMGKRGAPDIFPPDEMDRVPAAGKRSIRAGPRTTQHHDVGMLRGDGAAWNGEASLSKTCYGVSSGAPVQDHYTYETGARVTDVEFPLGKRMVPRFQ